MIHQELNEWDENVKAFVKEKQMTEEVQEEFLTEYDSHLFRGVLCNVEWFYNELYETRLIEHEGVWYKSGDLIQIKEKRSFLFWYLPFFKTVTYQIDFIGSDCSALLKNPKTKELRTITGNVNVL